MRRWRALVDSHWRGSPYPRGYKSGQVQSVSLLPLQTGVQRLRGYELTLPRPSSARCGGGF